MLVCWPYLMASGAAGHRAVKEVEGRIDPTNRPGGREGRAASEEHDQRPDGVGNVDLAIVIGIASVGAIGRRQSEPV